MAHGQSGHQHPEHKEGLGTGLIFHVKGHGVSQQPDVLEGDLGNDQQNQQNRCEMLAEPDQDGNHRQLKNIDHRGADPTGALDAEHHRQRLKPEFTVALNALEVVDDSNSKTRKAVGQALFGQLTWGTALLTLAYSLAGLGIAVVNDFKSVEGDRELGLQSLPVVFGIERASWISAAMIDVFQLAMVAVLIGIGQHFAAVLLVLLIVPQITFQDIWLLRDPVAFDAKYQASAQPFLVLGMLVTALAVGHSPLTQLM